MNLQEAFSIYSALPMSEMEKIGAIMCRPFDEFCNRASRFEQPFGHLKTRHELWDPEIRCTVELAELGNALALRWLERFRQNRSGSPGTDVSSPLTFAESQSLFQATLPRLRMTSDSPFFPHDATADGKWSPSAVARDEFLARFGPLGFQRSGKQIVAERTWGTLVYKSEYGSVKRALTQYFEVEAFRIPFSLAEPFMFSSGDVYTHSRNEFVKRLAAILDEVSNLFSHYAEAIDSGVSAGLLHIGSHASEKAFGRACGTAT
jgi:hypothetical protein